MDKHNKNEKTIVLRPTVDYRDPEQKAPDITKHFSRQWMLDKKTGYHIHILGKS